jgi:hypothetical protein
MPAGLPLTAQQQKGRTITATGHPHQYSLDDLVDKAIVW